MTDDKRLQRILAEAAEYTVLAKIYRSDPAMGADTVELLRECFRTRERKIDQNNNM